MAQNSTVKVRDVLWDNVKAMLIFTVVIGHMISRYRSESEAMNTLYLCIPQTVVYISVALLIMVKNKPMK